jgi:hypothetical protein
MAVPIDTDLYEKAKRIVYKQYKTPSAYRSIAVQKKYKAFGGRYRDDGDKPLERWFKEKWVSLSKPNQYPVYRPTVKVSGKTPLTVAEIDPKNLQSQIRRKLRNPAKNLPPFLKKRN